MKFFLLSNHASVGLSRLNCPSNKKIESYFNEHSKSYRNRNLHFRVWCYHMSWLYLFETFHLWCSKHVYFDQGRMVVLKKYIAHHLAAYKNGRAPFKTDCTTFDIDCTFWGRMLVAGSEIVGEWAGLCRRLDWTFRWLWRRGRGRAWRGKLNIPRPFFQGDEEGRQVACLA